MSSTEIAAWWGAIIASLVLLWDIFKWKKQGAQLLMRLSPNMQVFGDPEREGITWVSIRVTNVGDRSTTINSVGLKYYENILNRVRKKAIKAAVFPNPSSTQPLPRVLNPGDEWVGLVPQYRDDKELDMVQMSNSGHLVIWLSRSDKPYATYKRLVIEPDA